MLGIFLSLLLIIVVLINIPGVQRYVARTAASYLSDRLHTKVSIDGFSLRLLDKVTLDGVFMADQKGDTLLYTRHLELNITDWFIFKQKPVLHYVGLDGAFINLQRPVNDSVWNYRFLEDAFASEQPAAKKKDPQPIQFDLKKVRLKDIRFSSIDKWIGNDMVMDLQELNINMDGVDFDRKHIGVQSITGTRTTFGLRDYKGGRPDSLRRRKTDYIDTTAFNPDKWTVSVKKIELKDARYFMDNPDVKTAPAGLFDEWKMDVRNVQVNITDLRIKGDTLRANLENLSADERCGLKIKKMKARVRVSPRISECADLYLETNNSIIRDYYAMHYNRFPDFLDYIAKVRMQGHLKEAHVAVDDIIFFAPEMKLFEHMEVKVNGQCGGTVDNLYANNAVLNDGKSQLNVGKFTMNNLPDVDISTIVLEQSLLQTSGANLYHYFPFLTDTKELNFMALGQIRVPFDFKGTIHDFRFNADALTGLGKIQTNMGIQQIMSPEPVYAGTLNLTRFNLGTFLTQSSIHEADGAFTFKGKHFDLDKMSIYTEGQFSRFGFEEYVYTGMKVMGEVTPTYFQGVAQLNDPNAKLDFDGKVQFTKNITQTDFKANIGYIDLQKLHILTESVRAQGLLEGHFTGTGIENFTGAAVLQQMKIFRDSTVLDIDSIYLRSAIEDGQKYLYAGTNNVNARIWGNYKLFDLPGAVQHVLSNYLPTYFDAPAVYNRNQLIHFDMQTEDISDLLSIFNRDLSLPQGGTVQGTLNTQNDQLVLQASLPKVVFDGIVLDTILVNGQGDYKDLSVNADVTQIGAGSNVFLRNLSLDSKWYRDSLEFNMTTSTFEELGTAKLRGKGFLQDDRFTLNILPSQFFLNNNKWNIASGNRIVYENGALDIENLSISSGNQQIYISKNDVEHNTAYIDLKNLSHAPLARLLDVEDMIRGGTINGGIQIRSLWSNQKIDFNLYSNDTRFNDDTLQKISLQGNYDVADGVVELLSNTGVSAAGGSATLSGRFSLDTNSVQSIDGVLNFNNAQLSWLSPFLRGFVNNLNGKVNGAVTISGNAAHPLTLGQLSLKEVVVRPEINGETYTVDDAVIAVNENTIEIGTMFIKDQDKNMGRITGNITHNKLKSFLLNIEMNSDKLRVLNLNRMEGERFYGTVFAKTRARIFGPAQNLNVVISAIPLEQSNLIIPIDFSSDLGEYNFIRFKKPETDVAQQKKKLKLSNKYNVRIDATINNNLVSTIILDPKTGDQLISKGTGNIVLEIPSDGDIRLNGIYKIDEGTYNFAFRKMQILNYNRLFSIAQGSTIVWNGDLYDAHLDVTGVTTVKARLYDLISNEINRINLSNQEIRDAQLAQMVNVRLNASGTLQNPEVNFKIELSENRSIGTYAYQKLERINNDEKQLLNQVASLLLLDQFAPPEGFMNNTAAVSSGTINNMTDIFSSVASSQLTNMANKLFKVQDLHVGVGYKNYNLSNSSDPTSLSYLNRNEAKLNVRKNFLNNRLFVDVGGVYDWGRPATAGAKAYSSNLAGDFRVQYLITPDGHIRFNIFRTSNYDALFQQNIARQGVGISYRKSFSNLKDLFTRAQMTIADSIAEPVKEVLVDTPVKQ
ncbi:translocation/assembly module TamB domain-containing protein [Edaphocola aurantiacus]|uniref:translocation/assembly module TamB domain-containing protein n=1 Tax=Edaphocola aurantiacus TaxID=2601682 RepID=UPI001C9470C8|nr:translocation/assembly module TamB domain-containing protein [Edaphocola aurantiacus]